MTDPLTDNADELFERAEAEHKARNVATAAALFAMAADAYHDDGNQHMAALALSNRAGALFTTGDYAGSATTYQAASQEAELAQEVELALYCGWGEADARTRLGDWPAVLATCATIVPMMRDYGFEGQLPDTLLLQARAEYFLDDEEAALATAEDAGEQFRLAGDISGRVRARDFMVTVLLYLDRTEAAVVTARDNHRVATSLADESAEPYYQRRLGEALWRDGEVTAAAGAFSTSQETYRKLGMPAPSALSQAWLGLCLEAVDRSDEAVAALSEAAAVLDAAGPRWTSERNRARASLADLHFEDASYPAAIAEYRALLRSVLSGAKAPARRHLRPIERLTASLVHGERPQEALADLAEVAPAEGQDAPLLGTALRAARCWARWHTEDRDAVGAEAAELLARQELGRTGLAQAWAMEMVGEQTESVAHLARAHSLYLEHSDYARAARVSRLVLDRTKGLLPQPDED